MTPAGIVLFTTFFAYGALVNGTNIDLSVGLGLSLFTFAVPGQVVLVDELARGGSILTAAIATTLTAIRLLPLSVSMMPVVRDKDTPRWMLMIIVHYVAVTVWIQSMQLLPKLPREQRAPFCLGMCLSLSSMALVATVIGFYASHLLPPNVAAATLLITPMYFFLSTFGAVKHLAEKYAFAIGSVLSIFFIYTYPDLALLGTGMIGGTAAYFIARRKRRND